MKKLGYVLILLLCLVSFVKADINGTTGDDQITGTVSDDIINGSAGNDTIDGGDGVDTLVYSGNISQYKLTIDTSSGIAYIIVGPDGNDTVSNIEFFTFDDISEVTFSQMEYYSISSASFFPLADTYTYTGDMILPEGTYDLNSFDFTVEGDLILRADGTVSFDKGELNVTGSLDGKFSNTTSNELTFYTITNIGNDFNTSFPQVSYANYIKINNDMNVSNDFIASFQSSYNYFTLFTNIDLKIDNDLTFDFETGDHNYVTFDDNSKTYIGGEFNLSFIGNSNYLTFDDYSENNITGNFLLSVSGDYNYLTFDKFTKNNISSDFIFNLAGNYNYLSFQEYSENKISGSLLVNMDGNDHTVSFKEYTKNTIDGDFNITGTGGSANYISISSDINISGQMNIYMDYLDDYNSLGFSTSKAVIEKDFNATILGYDGDVYINDSNLTFKQNVYGQVDWFSVRDSNVTVDGNFTMESGTLSIYEGAVLHIKGNLYLSNNSILDISSNDSASLIVDGEIIYDGSSTIAGGIELKAPTTITYGEETLKITGVFSEVGGSEEIETFNVTAYSNYQSSSASSSIFSRGGNFELYFDINVSGTVNRWWYNFDDEKLYPLNDGSDSFNTIIDLSNNYFPLDLSVADYVDDYITLSISAYKNGDNDISNISFLYHNEVNNTMDLVSSYDFSTDTDYIFKRSVKEDESGYGVRFDTSDDKKYYLTVDYPEQLPEYTLIRYPSSQTTLSIISAWDGSNNLDLNLSTITWKDFEDYYYGNLEIDETVELNQSITVDGNLIINGDLILGENAELDITSMGSDINISGGIIYKGGTLNYDSAYTTLNVGKTAPLAPEDLNLSIAYNPTRVILNWKHDSIDNDGFNILRNGIEINNVVEYDAVSFSDDNVSQLQTYSYIVQADNVYGETNSTAVTIKVPLGLTINLDGIDLLESNITNVWVKGTGDNNETLNIPDVQNLSLTDINLSSTVPVYNEDQNFSIYIEIGGSEKYWLNFEDGKLYEDNMSSNLVTEINISNNSFDINLSSGNFVFINTAPVLSQDTFHFSTYENTSDSFEINVSDTNTLFYTMSGTDSEFFEVNASTGVFEFKSQPDYETILDSDNNNIYEFNITVSDGEFNVTAAVDVTVYNVDEAPVLETSLDNITLNEDFEEFNVTLNVYDAEDDNITFNINSSNEDIATVTLEDGKIIVTPVENANGTATIDLNITANDKTISQSFDIEISPVNDESIFKTNLSNISIKEDKGITTFELNVSDVDGDELNITVESNNSSILTASSSWNGEVLLYGDYNEVPLDFNLSTVNNAAGLVQIKLNINDGESNISQIYEINVTNINDTPVLDRINDLNITGYKMNSVQLVAYDVDDSNLTYSYENSNNNIVSLSIKENKLNIQPLGLGSTNIEVTVSDGNLSDTKSFNVNVLEDDNSTVETVGQVALVNGWNFISFPTSSVVCDQSIQEILSFICNQEFNLNSIFGDDSISYMFKYNDGWEYWDQEGNDWNGTFSTFKSISSNEGFIVKTTKANTINVPTMKENEEDNFVKIYKEGWYLAGINEDKSVEDIRTLVLEQSRMLIYLWVYREGTWYLYAPLNADTVDYPAELRVESIGKDESFWILVN